MKKIILSLAISCLVMGSDCFAAKSKTIKANSSQKESKVSLYQMKIKPALKKFGVNIQKTSKRKDVRIVFGATAIAFGAGALMYRYSPNLANYSKIWNGVKKFFGYKPAPTKWKRTTGYIKEYWNSLPAYVRKYTIFASFMGAVYLYLVY